MRRIIDFYLDFKVPIDCLRSTEKAKCPLVATPGSVGSDLFSAYKYKIKHMEAGLVKTDLVICILKNHFGLIGGRSCLALKGIQTHVGKLDSDYRGHVCVVITNLSQTDFEIGEGDRVGQISILEYQKPKWVEVHKIVDLTQRKGDFGSTSK